MVVVGLAVGVQRVPDREGNAEETLTADEPVAVEALDPVLVPMTHVLGHPLEFLATLQQCLAQVGVTSAVADVPLTGTDDLQRLVALLVEVRLALGGLGLTVHLARLHQGLDDELAGGEGGLAGNGLVPVSCSSRHQATSVRSPKVQHMAIPAPLSISAAV